MERLCARDGCGAGSKGHFDGVPLCSEHYRAAFEGELWQRLETWDSQAEPEQRLRYLFARAVDEFCDGHSLSKGRIEQRAWAMRRKGPSTIEFEITRHPGAFVCPERMTRKVQTWSIDLRAFRATLLSERPWTKEDPDP